MARSRFGDWAAMSFGLAAKLDATGGQAQLQLCDLSPRASTHSIAQAKQGQG
jgi:hypothetical protein